MESFMPECFESVLRRTSSAVGAEVQVMSSPLGARLVLTSCAWRNARSRTLFFKFGTSFAFAAGAADVWLISVLRHATSGESLAAVLFSLSLKGDAA